MERAKQLLGRAKYKLAVDTEFNYKLNLESTMSPLKDNLNKIISVLSQEQVSIDERYASTKYRFLGRLNIITDNTVTIIDNNGDVTPKSRDWSPMFYGGNQNTPPKDPYNWVLQMLYPYRIDKYTKVQTNQAYRGITIKNLYNKDISGTKSQVYLETLQKHGLEEGDFFHLYSITSNSIYTGTQKVEFLGDEGEREDYIIRLKRKYKIPSNNLILKKVVGPSDNDINYIDPIDMYRITTSDISGGTANSNYIKVTTGTLSIFSGVTHNLREGDYVDVRVNDNNYTLNGLHRVENIVNRYEFILDLKIGNTPNTVINNINVRFRRMDGVPSDYYIRKFKLISDTQYEVTEASSFGNSIYPKSLKNEFGVANKTWLFNFINNVDTKNLYNHRGGEPTQIHIATIKRAGKNPFNWSNVTAHWDFQRTYSDSGNSIENISVNNTNGVGSIEKKLVGIDEYFGDFVEYNRFELLEKTISKIVHRFSLNNAPTIENGYYLEPFQQINIRKYSNKIEEALLGQKVVGIPGDAEKRPNGDIIWRDVLTPGFIEEGNNGVDYPFLNGSNYVYTNKHLFVRRQDPDESITIFNEKTVEPIIVC